MKHVFKATKLGWDQEQDAIWFDSDMYTKEQAEDEIKTYEGVTRRGFLYTGYGYDGVKYHDITYLGEFKDNELPHNDQEYWAIKTRQAK